MNLKEEMTGYVSTVLQSPKIALSVSGGTVATGSATWLSWIPQEIGFYASAVGIVLSLVFIYNNIKGGIIKRRLDLETYKVARLQKEQLTHELDEIRGKNV